MNKLVQQMVDHGVNVSRYQFASFCYGRGWRGHTTEGSARKAAERDARAAQRAHGGGPPQHFVAETKTGVRV